MKRELHFGIISNERMEEAHRRNQVIKSFCKKKQDAERTGDSLDRVKGERRIIFRLWLSKTVQDDLKRASDAKR